MLASILATFRAAGRPLRPVDLSRDLGIEQWALEGMLETLVARGRLCRLDPASLDCGGCPVRGGCFIISAGVAPGYVLAPDA